MSHIINIIVLNSHPMKIYLSTLSIAFKKLICFNYRVKYQTLSNYNYVLCIIIIWRKQAFKINLSHLWKVMPPSLINLEFHPHTWKYITILSCKIKTKRSMYLYWRIFLINPIDAGKNWREKEAHMSHFMWLYVSFRKRLPLFSPSYFILMIY